MYRAMLILSVLAATTLSLHIVTYGAMLDLFNLPEEARYIGPLCKVFDEYTTVGGLTMPVHYTTYVNGQIYGKHTIEDLSISVADAPDDLAERLTGLVPELCGFESYRDRPPCRSRQFT